MTLNLKHDAFFLQKKDNSLEEYEDAFSTKDLETEYRLSIADGATESSFSGIWAKLLTEGYSESTSIEELKKDWSKHIESLELPWYSQEKASQGAFAAFLGLSIFEEGNNFEAVCTGDCCLFLVRDNSLVESFPIKSANQFDNSPVLISSIENKSEEFDIHRNKWRSGDIILLMTDAIAAWFLYKLENHIDSISMIMNLSNQEEFEKLVAEEREVRLESGLPALKNDDVTLLRIVLED